MLHVRHTIFQKVRIGHIQGLVAFLDTLRDCLQGNVEFLDQVLDLCLCESL